MQGVLATAAAILVASFTGVARAEDAEPAKLAYEQALSRYESGDVAGALASMRESFRLSGRRELLYNIARLEEQTGDCSGALGHYRQYLESVPDGQLRTAAERAIESLPERCSSATGAEPSPTPSAPLEPVPEASSAAPVTVAAPPSPPPTPVTAPVPPASSPAADGARYRWLAWSAIAAGAVAGGGALYLRSQALETRDEWKESVLREQAGGPWADRELLERQHREERWAQVLAIGGGTLIGGGVLYLVFAGRRSAPSPTLNAGFLLIPGSGAATLSGRF